MNETLTSILDGHYETASQSLAALKSYGEYCDTYAAKITKFLEQKNDTAGVISIIIPDSEHSQEGVIGYIKAKDYNKAINDPDSLIEVVINNVESTISVTGQVILDSVQNTLSEILVQGEFLKGVFEKTISKASDLFTTIKAKFSVISTSVVENYAALWDADNPLMSIKNFLQKRNSVTKNQSSDGAITLYNPQAYIGDSVNVWSTAVLEGFKKVESFFNNVWTSLFELQQFFENVWNGLKNLFKWLVSKAFGQLVTNYEKAGELYGLIDVPLLQTYICRINSEHSSDQLWSYTPYRIANKQSRLQDESFKQLRADGGQNGWLSWIWHKDGDPNQHQFDVTSIKTPYSCNREVHYLDPSTGNYKHEKLNFYVLAIINGAYACILDDKPTWKELKIWHVPCLTLFIREDLNTGEKLDIEFSWMLMQFKEKSLSEGDPTDIGYELVSDAGWIQNRRGDNRIYVSANTSWFQIDQVGQCCLCSDSDMTQFNADVFAPKLFYSGHVDDQYQKQYVGLHHYPVWESTNESEVVDYDNLYNELSYLKSIIFTDHLVCENIPTVDDPTSIGNEGNQSHFQTIIPGVKAKQHVGIATEDNPLTSNNCSDSIRRKSMDYDPCWLHCLSGYLKSDQHALPAPDGDTNGYLIQFDHYDQLKFHYSDNGSTPFMYSAGINIRAIANHLIYNLGCSDGRDSAPRTLDIVVPCSTIEKVVQFEGEYSAIPFSPYDVLLRFGLKEISYVHTPDGHISNRRFALILQVYALSNWDDVSSVVDIVNACRLHDTAYGLVAYLSQKYHCIPYTHFHVRFPNPFTINNACLDFADQVVDISSIDRDVTPSAETWDLVSHMHMIDTITIQNLRVTNSRWINGEGSWIDNLYACILLGIFAYGALNGPGYMNEYNEQITGDDSTFKITFYDSDTKYNVSIPASRLLPLSQLAPFDDEGLSYAFSYSRSATPSDAYGWYETTPVTSEEGLNCLIRNSSVFTPYVMYNPYQVAVHYQSYRERVDEAKKILLAVVVAIIGVTIAITVFKFRKKRSIKLELAQMRCESLGYDMSANPTKAELKQYVKARNKMRRISKMNTLLGIGSGDSESNLILDMIQTVGDNQFASAGYADSLEDKDSVTLRSIKRSITGR